MNFLTPSPPGEKASTRQDEARQSRTDDGTGRYSNSGSNPINSEQPSGYLLVASVVCLRILESQASGPSSDSLPSMFGQGAGVP
jgi:hypothetical protein